MLTAIAQALEGGLEIVKAAPTGSIPGVLQGAACNITAAEAGHRLVGDLIDTMFELNAAAPGVGLAAPQVGLPLRLFIIETPQYLLDERIERTVQLERGMEPIAPYAAINPTWGYRSGSRVSAIESCLSLPLQFGEVRRWSWAGIRLMDRRGNLTTRGAVGWHARIVQHEMDHLAGILWPDRQKTD